jgi:hypothetical protein
VIGVLVGAVFWVPPMVLAARLAKWSRSQVNGERHTPRIALALLLALVAWWVVLVGVGGGLMLLVVNVWNRAFHNAALVAVPLVVWSSVMVWVIRRSEPVERPYELVNLLALWALGLGLPMLGLFLAATAI